LAPAVSANLVTVGNIQTNDTINFMTDITTGRMYSRLGATLSPLFLIKEWHQEASFIIILSFWNFFA
jgi:hypothetical protein